MSDPTNLPGLVQGAMNPNFPGSVAPRHGGGTMRDPKMILVIEEERQAAVLEIDRLRAELAVVTSDRNRLLVISNSVIDERDSFRAELADAQLERDTALTDSHDTIQDLRAELAAKDRIIANLNERSAQYERDSVAKDARIAELEAWKATCQEVDCYRVSDARAERAEARIAELENTIDLSDIHTVKIMTALERAEDALREQLHTKKWYTDRAERAEAELKSEHDEFESLAAILAEWKALARSAEAERDAAMNVVQWVETWVGQPVGAYSVYALDGLFGMTRDKIAALAPSPAGDKT